MPAHRFCFMGTNVFILCFLMLYHYLTYNIQVHVHVQMYLVVVFFSI